MSFQAIHLILITIVHFKMYINCPVIEHTPSSKTFSQIEIRQCTFRSCLYENSVNSASVMYAILQELFDACNINIFSN